MKLDPTFQAFRDRFIECCEEFGSLNRLAEHIGVHKNTLGKYRKGTEPPRQNLVKIAEGCGVTLEWLATGRGNKRAALNNGTQTPVTPINWIMASEFTGCTVSKTGVIEIQRGRPTLMIPDWLVSVAFRGGKSDVLDRFVSFSVKDSFMSPDMLRNEIAFFQVERTVQPETYNGIYAIFENGEVYARYVNRINDDTIILSHPKLDIVGARRISVNDLGAKLIILGRVLLVGAWPGLRHTYVEYLKPVKMGPEQTIAVMTEIPRREEVIANIEKIGGRVLFSEVSDEPILIRIDEHSVGKLVLLGGVTDVQQPKFLAG